LKLNITTELKMSFFKLGFLVAIACSLAACEPSPQYTMAEKEQFFADCSANNGTPGTRHSHKANLLFLSCAWELPTPTQTASTAANQTRFTFEAYEVASDGIWIDSSGYDRLRLYMQACSNLGGITSNSGGMYEYCNIDGTFFEKLNLTEAFKKQHVP
jgi:hypothetical protein